MNIELINVDSKIPNLALMKISAWHKKQGAAVEFFNPMFSRNIDKIYISKVFSFTPDFQYNLPDVEIIKGGSGYSLDSYLPEKIENICPDYSLFNCDYAMGFTTRGCVRNCPFCIVPEKEGKTRIVSDIYQFWNGQHDIVIMDNNIMAIPDHFDKICSQIIKENIAVDFNQGLDIRLLGDYEAEYLSQLNIMKGKRIRFSFDDLKLKDTVESGVARLRSYGIPRSMISFYFLIGFDTTPEEDMERLMILKSLKVDAFCMPYDKYNPYQKQFTEWVNRFMYKVMTFEEFLKVKR